MSLSSGVRLGVYEIVALVGSGGMGEVYRARDPRLGRDVAVKVLPPAFATDEERLRRFEQEARAAAALNHPNILAVFDIGSHDGAPYVVSELLEGETLRDRLKRSREGSTLSAFGDQGPLPVRKAIDYAVQIAHGLAAAHDKGIVHRDLKPENVFVTEDGRVKILDFGLAKLTERAPALSGATAIPTLRPDTLPGVVLGTIGYMSPEQVRGLSADHRSDIFSFGTILYELLSGQRAFRGETSADTMTAILKDDPPDLPTAERKLPAALARIVDRCLEKTPAARFQSAEDLAFALDALSTQSGATESMVGLVAVPKASERRSRVLVVALSAALVAALAWAAIAQFDRAPIETRAMRFTIAPPEGWSIPISQVETNIATVTAVLPLTVSPDGRRVAFIARSADAKALLWVRPLDSLTSQMLPGTEGVSAPFWSPDSRFVGFFADGKLKKIDVSDGRPPVTLCEVGNGLGGSWSRSHVIVFSAVTRSGPFPILRVSDAGGVPVAATTVVQGDSNHTRPVFLPDGRHFLYTVVGPTSKPVYLASLDASDRQKLLDTESTNVLYSQGHLLFLRGTTLMAQPIDLKRLTMNGDVFPVADQIQTQTTSSNVSGIFSASDSGVLVYQTGTAVTRGSELAWFDRTGHHLATVGDRGDYGDLELAPDGKRAAVTVLDREVSRAAGPQPSDVWLFDLARGIRTRLTSDPAADSQATWSPDGARLVFASSRKGPSDLYIRASNGSGSDEVLLADEQVKGPMSWSADGRFILYTMIPARAGGRRGGRGQSTSPADAQRGLWALPLFGDRKPFPVVQSEFLAVPARLSPDGHWMAYVSNDSGRFEVFVTPFPGPGGKTQISSSGGTQPRWRRDGKELFYRALTPETKLMAAAVAAKGDRIDVSSTQELFAIPMSGFRYSYDVTADGQRFLVNMVGDQTPTTPSPLTVVVNWTTAMGRQ